MLLNIHVTVRQKVNKNVFVPADFNLVASELKLVRLACGWQGYMPEKQGL